MPSRDEIREALKVDLYDRGLSVEKLIEILKEDCYNPKIREIPWDVQRKVVIELLKENGVMSTGEIVSKASEILEKEYGRGITREHFKNHG